MNKKNGYRHLPVTIQKPVQNFGDLQAAWREHTPELGAAIFVYVLRCVWLFISPFCSLLFKSPNLSTGIMLTNINQMLVYKQIFGFIFQKTIKISIMTGPELKPLLFPGSSEEKKNGEIAACARHLQVFMNNSKIRSQHIRRYLQMNRVNSAFLEGYADYKGFDTQLFIKWARGPLTTEMYKENKPHIMLNEPESTYQRADDELNLTVEIKKVLADNTTLVKMIEERNNLIVKLIDKKE